MTEFDEFQFFFDKNLIPLSIADLHHKNVDETLWAQHRVRISRLKEKREGSIGKEVKKMSQGHE